jgi:hypothetical protein
MIVGEISYGGPNTDPMLAVLRIHSQSLVSVGIAHAYLVWDGRDNTAPAMTTSFLEASVWANLTSARRDKRRVHLSRHFDPFPTTTLPRDARYFVRSVEAECRRTSPGRYVICCDPAPVEETNGLLRRTYLRTAEPDNFFGQQSPQYGLAATPEHAVVYSQREGAIAAMRAAHAQAGLGRRLSVALAAIETARQDILEEALRRATIQDYGGFVLRCRGSEHGVPYWHSNTGFARADRIEATSDVSAAACYDSWDVARNELIWLSHGNNDPEYITIEPRIDAVLAYSHDRYGRPRRHAPPVAIPSPAPEPPAIPLRPLVTVTISGGGGGGGGGPRRQQLPSEIRIDDPRRPELPVQHGLGDNPPPPPMRPPAPAPAPAPAPVPSIRPFLVRTRAQHRAEREALAQIQADQAPSRETVSSRSRDRLLTPEEQQAVTYGDFVRFVHGPFIHLIVGIHLDELIGLRCQEREPGIGTPLELQHNTLRIIQRDEICWSSRQPAAPASDHRHISLDES